MRIKLKIDEKIFNIPIHEEDTLENFFSKSESLVTEHKMPSPRFYFFRERMISRESSAADLTPTLRSLGLKDGSLISTARHSPEEKITSLSALISYMGPSALNCLHSYTDTESLTSLICTSQNYPKKNLMNLFQFIIITAFKLSILEGKHILKNYPDDHKLRCGFLEELQSFSVRKMIDFCPGVLDYKIYNLKKSDPNIPIIAVASGNLEFIKHVAETTGIDFSMAIYGMRLSLRLIQPFTLLYQLLDLYKKKHQSNGDKLAAWFRQQFPLLSREFMFPSDFLSEIPTNLLHLIEGYLHPGTDRDKINLEDFDSLEFIGGWGDTLESNKYFSKYKSTYFSEKVVIKAERYLSDPGIFLSEAVAMQDMSGTSDFVLGLKDVIFEPNLILVSEYYEDSLSDFLKKAKRRGIVVNTWQKLFWAEQISVALEKIHEQDIIHYRFYIHNIFLNFYGKIKIGSFSKLDFVESGSLTSVKELPAPEHVESSKSKIEKSQLHTKPSNVYLLGLVLIQMFTDITVTPDSILDKNELLKKFPSDCPQDIIKLILTCVDEDPNSQPLASKVQLAFFNENRRKAEFKDMTTSTCLLMDEFRSRINCTVWERG